MTLRIPLSAVESLPFDFSAAVEDYRAAREMHAGTIGEPAPLAPHPWVEQAVIRVPPPPDSHPEDGDGKDSFYADYQIIDDAPLPPPLDEQKLFLAAKVAKEAEAAQERVWPRLKRRLDTIEAMAALGKNPAARSEEDNVIVSAYEDRMAKFDQIERFHGVLESKIHDLTEETIGEWQIPAFPY